MKYIKTALLFAVAIAIAFLAPLFVFAFTPPTQDNGTTAGTISTPITQDNGTTAGTVSTTPTPTTQDNGTTAGTINTPATQDNGTTAGTGSTPATQGNGTTAGTSTTPSGGGNTGGGGRGGGGGIIGIGKVIQISNIQVRLASSSIPTTTLIVGQNYVISWQASAQNVNTTLSLVPISSGSNILIGTTANPSPIGTNKVNWTVPASVTLGNYTLRFTDSGNRITNSPNVYKIVAARSTSSNNSLGIGGGTLPLIGGQASTTPLSGVTEENSASTPLAITQTASVGNAFSNFWGSKYVFWFFILFLIVVTILLVQERRNLNESKNKIPAPAPIIKPTPAPTSNIVSTPKQTPISPISTSTSKPTPNPIPKKYN